MANAKIRLNDVSKVYTDESGRQVKALQGVSFDVHEGEFLCLLGPSGCGKTTLLRLVAGLEHPTAGEVSLDNKPISKPGSERGMIFQEFALFPWKSVIKNIEFAMEIRGLPKRERTDLARQFIEMTALQGFEDSYPHEISGGMKQRVAVARALASEPEVLLMDEPFGTLDAQTRNAMQEELLSIWEKTAKTVLFVTHCVNETTFLADRVIVLTPRPGRVKEIIQVDLKRPRLRTGEKTVAMIDQLRPLLGSGGQMIEGPSPSHTESR